MELDEYSKNPYTTQSFMEEHLTKSTAYNSHVHYDNGYTKLVMANGANFYVPTKSLLAAQKYCLANRSRCRKYIIRTVFRDLDILCNLMVLECIIDMFKTVKFNSD
jgi:hypothetical protein